MLEDGIHTSYDLAAVGKTLSLMMSRVVKAMVAMEEKYL